LVLGLAQDADLRPQAEAEAAWYPLDEHGKRDVLEAARDIAALHERVVGWVAVRLERVGRRARAQVDSARRALHEQLGLQPKLLAEAELAIHADAEALAWVVAHARKAAEREAHVEA